MPVAIKVEKRLTESRTARVLVPIASLILALVLGGGLLLLVGADPLATYAAMFSGAFGGRYAFSETLVKATPLVLAGLGVSIAFRMLFWNIGAEGQLAMGGFAAAGVALFVAPSMGAAPGWLLILLAMLAALIGGALWALIPALLKAFVNVNEIITTLMLNYVAVLWIEYLFYGPWKDPKGYGFPGSAQFIKPLWLGRIDASWLWPMVVLLVLLFTASSGLAFLRRSPSRLLFAVATAAGGAAMLAGWFASPPVAQGALRATTWATQGWLLPEGLPQAAPVGAILAIAVFGGLTVWLERLAGARSRSTAMGAIALAISQFCGGLLAGQAALLILLLTGTRVTSGLLVGVAAAVFLYLLLARTRWGYEIRVIGENRRAAAYAGINLTRSVVLVAMLSGGLAGLAGAAEVLGVAHRLQKGLTVGYGYTAILVAWLAALNPWGIVLWGILWAALLVGGDQIQISMQLPAAVAPSLQGLMVFCVLGGQFFIRNRVHFVRSSASSAAVGAAERSASHE